MQKANIHQRQMLLKEIGNSGQEKIKNSSVLVVGLGGLGNPVALQLALTGVGKIGLCDGDTVDVSNLHRQFLFQFEDCGQKKVDIVERELIARNPNVIIQKYNQHFEFQMHQKIKSYDLILDCTDDIEVKFLLHDLCFYYRKELVQGSIYKWEGTLQRFSFNGADSESCWRCLWDESPRKRDLKTCQEVGVLGTVAGLFGDLMALEVIKSILGMAPIPHDEQIIYSPVNYDFQRVKRIKNRHCSLCSKGRNLNMIESLNRCRDEGFVVELDNRDIDYLVDIRLSDEDHLGHSPTKGVLHWPLSEFSKNNLNNMKKYLFRCESGVRSFKLVQSLRNEGFNNVFALSEKSHYVDEQEAPPRTQN